MNDQPTPPATDHVEASALLRGELTNAEALRAADHLDRCEACRSELVTTAVGHGLLTASRRTFAPVARPAPTPVLPPAPTPPTPTRRRWAVALVAAAAAVVVGAVAVTAIGGGDEPVDPDRPEIAPARLAVLDPVEGAGSGRVEMVDGDGTVRMTVSTSGLPAAGADEYYEVWLFDPPTNKMLSLGLLAPDGTGGFELPRQVLRRYEAIDISLERDDGDPAHSVTSVLQGTYAEGARGSTATG